MAHVTEQSTVCTSKSDQAGFRLFAGGSHGRTVGETVNQGLANTFLPGKHKQKLECPFFSTSKEFYWRWQTSGAFSQVEELPDVLGAQDRDGKDGPGGLVGEWMNVFMAEMVKHLFLHRHLTRFIDSGNMSMVSS